MSLLRHHPASLTLATGFFAALAACGGGGTSSDPIDPYIATFVGVCTVQGGVTDAQTGATLYSQTSLRALSKTSANQALMQEDIALYDAHDCSGTARASLSVSGANTWLRVDGRETVEARWVDKVTRSEDAKLAGASGGTSVTANGITYAASFVASDSQRNIYDLDSTGELYGGDFSQPLDADGYPTVLSATPFAYRR